MPNHQRTNIRISAKKEIIDELLKSVVATEEYLAKIEKENENLSDEFKIEPNELGEVDFNILVPKPNNIYNGNIGLEEDKKHGKNNWHDWNIANWGTKWNAYESVVARYSEEKVEIAFLTAWCFPKAWFNKFVEKAIELGVKKIEGETADEFINDDVLVFKYNAKEKAIKYCRKDSLYYIKKVWREIEIDEQ